METILLIDTTDSGIIKVGLKIGGKEYVLEQKMDKQKSQAVLPMIDKILNDKNIKLNEITAIQVNTGPGSFTGIRVGLSVANTLAFILKIPVNGKPVGELAEPQYT